MERRPGPRVLRALNPFRSLTALRHVGAAPDGLERAIAAVRERVADAPEDDRDWFGWPLPAEPRNRYVAVGFPGRGFVVDVVSGHVLWEGPVAGRDALPRSLADVTGG